MSELDWVCYYTKIESPKSYLPYKELECDGGRKKKR